MSYELFFTNNAKVDIQSLQKSGDKQTLKKLTQLLTELVEHPESGTGKPEQLKHAHCGCWARRLNKKHRVIYCIRETVVEVLFVFGHYGDK